MNDDPVWVQTLALRLRSLYGADDSGANDADAASASDGSQLAAALEHRLADLRRTALGQRYRIVGTLAEGGMGHVLAAIDDAVGRPVAIKRAARAARAADSLRHRLRLLDEAAVIGRLQHPGVVPIHDLGIDEHGEPFFAMQRVDGHSLGQLLRAGSPTLPARPPLPRLVEILRRVAETMAYAHSRGVVHRDLKPANVMVGAYGEVYVMDWGLARVVGGDPGVDPDGDRAFRDVRSGDDDAAVDLTRSGTVLGTPSYMPPERAHDPTAGDVDPRADVYGLGAMLYEVLAGAPPYASERAAWTVDDILAAIRAGPPRPVLDLQPAADRELVAIQERAMHRDRERRYADMRELQADLQAWAEHRIVGAHGGGAALRLRKWVRRNRAPAATAATAALMLVAATVWFVAHLSDARDEATASARAAAANLQEVLDLAVVQRITDLRRRADTELWPLAPERAAATEAWLREAESLRPTLASLQARRREVGAAPDASADLRDAGESADPTRAAQARWRRQLLDDALAALAAFFAAPEPGDRLSLDSTVAAVRQRQPAAGALATASTDGDAVRERWRQASAVIEALPAYGGLRLAPQFGLVPLGPDPRSGLWEFAHLQTGTAPRRDADGTLQFDADSGVVLVLVPGGTFAMGAAAGDPRHPDPWAEAINEGPVHDVTLRPFFVGKFELTQGQWLRATGSNPSVHTAASDYVDDERWALHPVESVDWYEARAVLNKLGLALPTEAQWEFAARAGTDTPWYRGAVIDDLLRPPAGNLADATSARALGTQGWMATPGLDDGFVMHAPVGSFLPNAFGLFDVIGNVAEWCADEYVSYARPPAPGTGARPLSAEPGTAMYRGGAFDEPAQEARSANRAGGPPTRRHVGLGVRPVRPLW